MDEEPCPACGRKIEDKLLDRYLMAKEIAKERAEVERLTGSIETLRELRELDRVLIERLRAALRPMRAALRLVLPILETTAQGKLRSIVAGELAPQIDSLLGEQGKG
jgi:hypothetical protein